MSILTVAQYREMSGTPSAPPTDAEIALALNRYTALIEGFVGRTFTSVAVTEQFYNCGAGPIQLRAYPVSSVTQIVAGASVKTVADYDIDLAAGLIYHEGSLYMQDVAVTYTGGYSDAPADVKVALATLVEAYLAGTYGGTSSLGAGQKETVMGVGSIDYGVSTQSYKDFGDPYADLGLYVSVLEKYREPGMA